MDSLSLKCVVTANNLPKILGIQPNVKILPDPEPKQRTAFYRLGNGPLVEFPMFTLDQPESNIVPPGCNRCVQFTDASGTEWIGYLRVERDQ